MDKDSLEYIFRNGYFNSLDKVDIPDGAMISPSSNVIYTKYGTPISVRMLNKIGVLGIGVYGGNRAFVLDENTVGYMGNNITTEFATGNMFQGIERSIWFVGNSIQDGVRVITNYITDMQIGGTNQIETGSVTAGATASANITARVTGAYISGSPVDVAVAVVNGDSNDTVASKVVAAFRSTAAITAQYYVKLNGAQIILQDKNLRANDATLAITLQNANGTGVTFGASTNTTAGVAATRADLSSIPQFCKWTGSAWGNAMQVGLAPSTSPPILSLTTDTTRGVTFSGLITGSISVRSAYKRGGTIGIASGASNVVTGDTDSIYCTIADYPEDGSDQADRSHILYFTFMGFGSQYAHLMFPIEIPESKLDGTEANGWTTTSGNARIKVISQDASVQANRIVEIEFNNNDLFQIQPFDDHYPAESCRFIAPLGNVLLLIGTGVDSTGFDVSFPNNREAFSPDWREWLPEVPVSIASNKDQDIIWILGTNTTYQARWTGATQETAPVILQEVSARYGAVGEGASVVVNGVLYFLSNGLTPVRIAPNGQIDDQFGKRVSAAFSTFNSTTQVGSDEATNSVVFFCGATSIAYQIDSDKWSAPCTQTFEGTDQIARSCVSLNGLLLVTAFNTVEVGFSSYKYNNLGGTQTWRAVGTFKTGKYGLALKDIIEGRAIVQATDEVNWSIVFKAHKNYITTAPTTLFTITGAAAGEKISTRSYIENALDYDTIALEATGDDTGQTVHYASLILDVHSIERQT